MKIKMIIIIIVKLKIFNLKLSNNKQKIKYIVNKKRVIRNLIYLQFKKMRIANKI